MHESNEKGDFSDISSYSLVNTRVYFVCWFSCGEVEAGPSNAGQSPTTEPHPALHLGFEWKNVVWTGSQWPWWWGEGKDQA
jgi:hypothetical protein